MAASALQAASSPHGIDYARIYAAFSSTLHVADLPPGIAAAARVNLLDTLACAAAGANAPGGAASGAGWGAGTCPARPVQSPSPG